MKEKAKISLKDLSLSSLKERLAKAHSHQFFFEAVYLISVLIENRVDKLISAADITLPAPKGSRTKSRTTANSLLSLSDKLTVIKEIVETDNSENDLLNQYIDPGLINDVLKWLEERNNMLAALTIKCPEPADVAELVFSGEMAVTNLSYCVKQYRKNLKTEKKDN